MDTAGNIGTPSSQLSVTTTGSSGPQNWSITVSGPNNQAVSSGSSPGQIGDTSPQGRTDTIVFTAGVVSGSPYLHWGTIGGAQAMQRLQITTSTMYEPTAIMDTVNYDLHVVGAMNGFPDGEVHYWRYRPIRNASGHITGWNQTAHVTIPTTFVLMTSPTLAEVTDGNGVKRIAVLGMGSVYDSVARAYLFVSTPTAGVSPTAASHFSGAQGETNAATLVATHTGTTNWESPVFIGYHPGSKTIEAFFASGLHGESGPHTRTPFALNATNGSRWVKGTTDLYATTGTSGGYASVGPNDSVWWTWSNGSSPRQKISRVDANGVVTHDVIPMPPEGSTSGAGSYPYMSSLVVLPDGKVATMVTTAFSPNRVYLKLWNGTAWSERHVSNYGFTNFAGSGFAGYTMINGVPWIGMYVTNINGPSHVAFTTVP
jgi:hypothetical protein